MMATQYAVKNSQDKKSEIETILEKLRQRDLELFTRVIDAIHNQDDYTSRALAHEVAEIRKAVNIIENASHQKYPQLLLCPICCSPEISISGNIYQRCHCLECGKIWNTRVDNNTKAKLIENVWSMA